MRVPKFSIILRQMTLNDVTTVWVVEHFKSWYHSLAGDQKCVWAYSRTGGSFRLWAKMHYLYYTLKDIRTVAFSKQVGHGQHQ